MPESVGDFINSGDWVYRIYPFKMNNATQTLHFAFAANEHPIKLLYKMWEEYSVSAQIRGGEFGHVQRLGPDIKTRT